MIRSGELTARIVIERRTVTRDPAYGSEVIAWTTHRETWAKLKDRVSDSNTERVVAGARSFIRTTTVILRTVPGITSDMRVRLKATGRLLQIVAIADFDDGDGMQLACESYDERAA